MRGPRDAALSRWERPLFCGYLAAVLCAALWLYTRHNDFPLGYHPDEMTKIRQIIDGQWNFYHPQLMLQTTRLFTHLLHDRPENVPDIETGWLVIPAGEYPRHVARIGRTVSAVFAALAVVLLAVAARLLFGPSAGYAVAPVLATSHALLTAGHYLKEDSSLILGIAAFTAALAWFARAPSRRRVLVVGTALGLAAAGKYVGLILLPFGLLLVWLLLKPASARERTIAVSWLVAAAIGTFIAINFEMLLHTGDFIAGVRFEAEHVSQAHRSIGTRRLSLYYTKALLHETSWLLLVLAAGFLVVGLARTVQCRDRDNRPGDGVAWSRLRLAQWAVGIFPIAWFCFASLSPIQAPRYLLPSVAFVYLLAGAALALLVTRRTQRWPAQLAISASAGIALAAPGLLICLHYLSLFNHDSRDALQEWARRQLPSEARIAADWYARLPLGELRPDGPVVLDSPKNVVSLGELEDLLDSGVTHVVLADLSYERYLSDNRVPGPAVAWLYRQYRQRYLELIDRSELVWTSRRYAKQAQLLNPQIEVYRLPRRP